MESMQYHDEESVSVKKNINRSWGCVDVLVTILGVTIINIFCLVIYFSEN